jgi:hypothetical protein
MAWGRLRHKKERKVAREEAENYYVRLKDTLMKKYDKSFRMQQKILKNYFDEPRANRWLLEARHRYELLIPHIPYIGGKDNGYTKNLIYSSGIMPLVEILRDEKVPTRKIGLIIFEMAAGFYNAIPAPIRWYLRWSYFGKRRKSRLRKAVARSQFRQYPGDWVFEFVEGDGKTFVYGIMITECGLEKFWRAHGLEEYIPYLCLTDWALWRAIGIAATRTQTIANGGECCDFKYVNKGKGGPSGWPPESNPEWTGRYET